MKTILLIEDNNDTRENTCEPLELEGYKIILALNGKIGLALAREYLPDLVLCDIMMLGANGYEVLNELQANVNTRLIPFIFLQPVQKKRKQTQGWKWVLAALFVSLLTPRSFLRR